MFSVVLHKFTSETFWNCECVDSGSWRSCRNGIWRPGAEQAGTQWLSSVNIVNVQWTFDDRKQKGHLKKWLLRLFHISIYYTFYSTVPRTTSWIMLKCLNCPWLDLLQVLWQKAFITEMAKQKNAKLQTEARVVNFTQHFLVHPWLLPVDTVFMTYDGHHWKVLSESESEISEDPMEAPVNASITLA